MAISTMKTYLMYKESSDYVKLVDIKSFPDLGGEPSMVESTTLSNTSRTYELGVQDQASMVFEANYDKTDYIAVKAIEGLEKEFAIWIDAKTDATGKPMASDNKFEWKGKLSVWLVGGGVDDIVGMSIAIAPSTDIELVTT